MPSSPGHFRKYAYGYITVGFFLFSAAGHFAFAMAAGDSLVEYGRDLLENWQSEFLQLLWQVGGLSLLLYWGSPQSKEGSERVENSLKRIEHALAVLMRR